MKNVPQFVCAESRRVLRHRLQRHAGEAFVEFDLSDERHHRFEVTEISTGGLCFVVKQNQLDLRRGSTIKEAVICVDETHIYIHGSLAIAHVTEEFSVGTIFGAQFRSATEYDERKLVAFIERLAGP